jgi:UDP-N-acetyl-D-glucosamine/UDP-N-acetyl-D-galactosamine dehydrogenase
MDDLKIGVVGLGYVGLPLAIEFGSIFTTIGFDINKQRIQELKNGEDKTLETEPHQFISAKLLNFTSEIKHLNECNIFIITVPTPIDNFNKPDLSFLKNASKLVGQILKKNDLVIYESTVYPGATEEFCVPILEKYSELVFNQDFNCGYSPERINPGDKSHRIRTIKKITSGSTKSTADFVDKLYCHIIDAGTFKAASIKVAEAAKVIENTQRDLNIALMNELSLIFEKLNIDTESVLEAAGSKWNFLPFRPGLVGGHCISVDPYYLTHKAMEVGYHPKIILAGRDLNDNMGQYIINRVFNLMRLKSIDLKNNPNILIMGFAFKENCPDIRNTRVIDLIEGFKKNNCKIDVYDPWINREEVIEHYGFETIKKPIKSKYDAIIIAVAHNDFKKLTAEEIKAFGKEDCVLFDVKYVLNSKETDGRL